MKILVTGGAGYIGTELIQELIVNSDSEIVIYDNLLRDNYNLFLEGKFPSDRIQFVNGDILDTRKLRKTLDGIEVVIHLAAKVTTPYADQNLHQYEQINHWGTSELVYNVENTDSVRNFIYLSSASVYGLGKNKTADEESEPVPSSHYGLSKLRGEEEVSLLKDRTLSTIIRSANVFGYSRAMRFDSVINRFMFDAHFKNKIKVYGNGDQMRPFISINCLISEMSKIIYGNESHPVKNLVEFNLSVNDIIDEGINKLYPGTDILFVGQDLPLKGLQLTSKYNNSILNNDFNKFREYLKVFKTKFTF